MDFDVGNVNFNAGNEFQWYNDCFSKYPKSKPYTLKTSANLDEHMTQCPQLIKKNLIFFDIVPRSPSAGFEPGPPDPQFSD